MKTHKIKFHKKSHIVLALSLVVIGSSGCKKFVEVDKPITTPTAEFLYNNDATAASVLSGIYTSMSLSSNFAQGNQGISLYAGLTADELDTYPAAGQQYVDKWTNSTSADYIGLWRNLYQQIYVTNAAIDGIQKSTGGMSDSVKVQLIGEAKFMRAYLYFYLVNLFGDVPLILKTEYRENAVARRSPKQQVWDQIETDLREAKTALQTWFAMPTGTAYASAATERVRPNKGAATAMLARVLLFREKWAQAETEATEVIGNALYKLVADPNAAFLKNNTEAIWQLQATASTQNTVEGNMFFRNANSRPNATEPSSVAPALVRAFETGDKRKTSWVDSVTTAGIKYYFPKKYDIKSKSADSAFKEYLVVLRMAEQYLIRAEARAKQGKTAEAAADINVIRTRAGLANTTAATADELLQAVEQERRIELMVEWGHRWLDLKRTNRVNDVMSVATPLKGGTWTPNMALWPVPGLEITLNPNLLPQNPGYN